MDLDYKRVYSLFAALGALLWISGCGYYIVGTTETGETPLQTKLHFSTLSNTTPEPLLEERLSQLISQELLTDHRIRLVNLQGKADSLLRGEITSFGETALSFDPSRNALEYRITITINLTLESVNPQTLYWKSQGIQTSAEYLSTNDTSVTRSAKDRAIREIGKNIAELILFQLFEEIRRETHRRPIHTKNTPFKIKEMS